MSIQSENPEKPAKANKSLLFAIEDVAKLLRTEAKKTELKLKKTTTSISSSSDFVNSVEQIAKLLRTQVRKAEPKKKRGWSVVKKKNK
jgi:DNA repair photolyase